MKINTGFKKHIDMLVDKEGERPSENEMDEIERLLGEDGKEKWFNVTGLGYDKNWMYVYGIGECNLH